MVESVDNSYKFHSYFIYCLQSNEEKAGCATYRFIFFLSLGLPHLVTLVILSSCQS